MAGPGGSEVGRVSVRVVPNLEDFRGDIEKELREVENMEAEIPVKLDLTEFKAQIEEIKAQLKSIQDETVNVNIDKDGKLSGLSTDIKKAADESKKLGEGLKNAVDGDGEKRVGRFASLMQGFAGFMTQAGTAAGGLASDLGGKLQNAFSGATSSIVSLIATMLVWIPLLAAAAAGITYLIGLVAAAIGGLPVLLAGLIAPITAVILGMDGIKAAAKTLSPEIDALKKRLSDTFEKNLTPVFKQLEQLMPVLSDGLNETAKSLSDFVGGLVKMATAKDTINDIKNAFAGVQDFIKALEPGVEGFIKSLLKVAGVTDLYKTFGKTISDVLLKFTGFFDQSLQDGSLQKGLENLDKTLTSVTGLFSALLRGSLKFFNGATPGMTKFFDSLSSFFLHIDWEKLGKAFGDAFNGISDWLDSLPQETIDSFVTSFSDLAKAIGDLLSGNNLTLIVGAFQLFLDIITGIIGVIDIFVGGLTKIGDGLAAIGDIDFSNFSTNFGGIFTGMQDTFTNDIIPFLGSLPDKIGSFFSGIGDWLFGDGQGLFSGFSLGMIGSWGENVVSFLGSVPSKIGAFFSGVGDWLKSAGTGVIGGLAGGISGGWVQVTSFLGGIPGKIAAFFGGAGSWLVGAGKNIINGLISGIKSAFNAVKSTLSNLTSLLPSWKGPPSTDAKLLTANGKLIMQSLVDGLSSGFKPVQSLLGGITNEIGGAFSDPALLSGMQVSGADITAAGSSALSVAGSVDGGAIASALEGWTVQLDETGLARLVNKGNNRVKRRR